MKITLLTIGKIKQNAPEAQLIAEYVKQCKWPITIIELEEKRKLPPEKMKEAESMLLLAHVPAHAKIVVLDEKGKNLSSRELSAYLTTWQTRGVTDVAFLIGGAYGHAEMLRAKADLVLSFGRMTLPHKLMRAVLAEQIYRAWTIAEHHPYHKD